MASELSADLAIFCWLFPTNDSIDLATTRPRKPDQSCSSLHICVSLIRTGESTVAATQPATEQKERREKKKHHRGGISQACRIDLLDCGCVSFRSQSLSTLPLPSFFPPFQKNKKIKISTCARATERRRLNASITAKDNGISLLNKDQFHGSN